MIPWAADDALRWLRRGEVLVAAWPMRTSAREQARLRARAVCREWLEGAAESGLALRVSRSATSGWALCAAALGVPVGVDVESGADEAPLDAAFAASIAASDDPDAVDAPGLLAQWTCKEAVLKAAGVGLAVHPRQVEMGRPMGGWRSVALPTGQRFALRQLNMPPGCAAALAVHGPPRRVRFRVADALVAAGYLSK